jgi:chemotaxis family two-component system response regulator Rcp1
MNNLDSNNPITILLVEDNPGDIRLLQEIFREGKVCNHLEIVRNGADAMAFLRKEGPYAEAPRPDLILLDLNLPKKNGNEVLAEIKQDEKLKRIPVIILTASQSEEDVSTAYNHYANCYLTKPIDLDQFIEVVHQIKSFWLSIVKIPEE